MRVIVAEDTMLTRQGIVAVLRDAGIDVLAQVGDGDELLREVSLDPPDVAVVDIRMPPTHTAEGLVAAERIRREFPGVGVLVLSQYVEPTYAMRLLQENPERVGYLLKDRVFDGALLVDALRRIDDGETVVDPTIVSRLLGRRRREDPSPSCPTGSARYWAWSPRDCPTRRSPSGCSSPSGPSRPTSPPSSASSGWEPTRPRTAGSWPSWPTCAPDRPADRTPSERCRTRESPPRDARTQVACPWDWTPGNRLRAGRGPRRRDRVASHCGQHGSPRQQDDGLPRSAPPR